MDTDSLHNYMPPNLAGNEADTNVGVILTYSLRHWEFLQLQCLFFPVTEALAAATVCASIIPLEDRERELEGGGGGGVKDK